MERIFLNIIPIKDLVYIIQEYMRENYTFLNELLENTKMLKLDSHHWIYYNKYAICSESNTRFDWTEKERINRYTCYYRRLGTSWKVFIKWSDY